MRINNNITALNTHRVLNINNVNISKSMEKLSSGLRINRAGDDAAGLSISEKMRGQIRGLKMASKNVQDGISLIQTAEGGLNEISAILQRVRELAVQSANGTNTDEDRDSIQVEVDQLLEEIQSIATNTEFNTLSLLDGKFNIKGESVGGSTGSIKDIVADITDTGGITDEYEYGDKKYASAVIDFSNLNSVGDVGKLEGKGVNYTCGSCTKAYSIKFVKESPDITRLNAEDPVMEVDITSVTNGVDLVNKIMETAYGKVGAGQSGDVHNPDNILTGVMEQFPNATGFVKHFSKLASDGSKIYMYDERSFNYGKEWPNIQGHGRFDLYVHGEENDDSDKVQIIDIQAGANEGQSIRLEIPNVTLDLLEIKGLLVDTQENANSAISKIDGAISRVSKTRSIIGAYQNRFEHIVKNVDNSAENLQDAESRIRDSDISEEMVKLSKYQILLQASQSMMAQANQMSQGVLQLLQ